MRMLRDPAHCFKISSPLSRNCAPCETQCPTARMFECALPTTIVILLCAQLAAHLHRLWCAPHGTSSVLCTVSAIFLLALLSQGTLVRRDGAHLGTPSRLQWSRYDQITSYMDIAGTNLGLVACYAALPLYSTCSSTGHALVRSDLHMPRGHVLVQLNWLCVDSG